MCFPWKFYTCVGKTAWRWEARLSCKQVSTCTTKARLKGLQRSRIQNASENVSLSIAHWNWLDIGWYRLQIVSEGLGQFRMSYSADCRDLRFGLWLGRSKASKWAEAKSALMSKALHLSLDQSFWELSRLKTQRPLFDRSCLPILGCTFPYFHILPPTPSKCLESPLLQPWQATIGGWQFFAWFYLWLQRNRIRLNPNLV